MYELQDDSAIVLDNAAMAKVAFDHFFMLLGMVEHREFSLVLDLPGYRLEDLRALDVPFPSNKAWVVVYHVPHGRSLGSNGFIA
jgi:hypothetical protein